MTVHNHGTEEGKGLACRETRVNGQLRGECMTPSNQHEQKGTEMTTIDMTPRLRQAADYLHKVGWTTGTEKNAQGHYDLLTGPWRKTVGKLHPDDLDIYEGDNFGAARE